MEIKNEKDAVLVCTSMLLVLAAVYDSGGLTDSQEARDKVAEGRRALSKYMNTLLDG